MAAKGSQDESFRLLDALCEGNLTPEDERRLTEKLINDPAACLLYVRYMDIHASLGQPYQFPQLANESFQPHAGVKNEANVPAGAEKLYQRPGAELLGQIFDKCVDAMNGSRMDSKLTNDMGECAVCAPRKSFWSYQLVFSLLLLGALAGSGVTWQLASGRIGPIQGMVDETAQAMDAGVQGASNYVATLVNVTNCRWDQTRSTAEVTRGGGIRSGESLHLLEGVAEITSTLPNGGMATLQLEGPLAITLTSEGMPNLLYGQLTGLFNCDYDRFTLNTPLGGVTVSGDASIGVMVAPNRVEVHVFSGAASLDLWTIGLGDAAKQLTATAGGSLSAQVGTDGRVTVNHGESRESWFVTPATVAESRLPISSDYVDAIRDTRPVAYWRFEQCVDGRMNNEMDNRFHCRMIGNAVRWHPGHDGSTVEFGTTAGPGYLISDDTLDLLTDDYTVELWAKPTYFHHGTLFSLLQWTPPQSPIGSHRMAIEICGPVSGLTSPYRTTDFHPGRIRFTHESRTRFDVDCFSSEAYAVRKWQHLVAVKTPSEMRLYVNGRPVASQAATGALPSGLRVLMGQILPLSPEIKDEVTSRLFTGELDEVALYDRALAEEEIQPHFELVRPNLEVVGERTRNKL
ncbi:MAG: LamG domain-containing protein [Pirellulales bacterium]